MWLIMIMAILCTSFCVDTEAKQIKPLSREKTQIELKVFEVDLMYKDLFKQFNYYLPTKRQMYVDFILTRNVSDFSMKLSFDVIKKDKRAMNLLRLDIDGCKYLESYYGKITAILVAMNEIFEKSNLPHKCPLLENKLYFIKNYTVNAKQYPDMLPAMDWQVRTKFFLAKKYQGQVLLKGEVRKF